MSADVEDFSRLCTKNSMLTWLLLDAVVTVLRYWINTDLISLAIKKQSSSSVHFQQQTKKLLAMQYPWFIYNAGKKDSRLSQHLESFSPTFIWVLGPKTLFFLAFICALGSNYNLKWAFCAWSLSSGCLCMWAGNCRVCNFCSSCL